jgi:hypothetical protein
VVVVEGAGLEGVTVELTGPQSRATTTDAAGRYTFQGVPSGAYVVSVSNAPGDASFPATSRTAVVSGSQTVTADFVGEYIRTASIEGTVTAASQGIPGITVTLRGLQTASTVTGPGGSFLFTGLRAGQYEVEISDLPESITFPSVRTDVNLAIGQRLVVTFTGVPALTASVAIKSIMRRTDEGATELADPQNLRGQLEVTLTVDRGEDTLESVELLLGDEVLASQTFGAGGMSAGGTSGPGPAPAQAATFDVVFLANTAEFDAETGDVRFANGQALLTARLATVEGGPSAWLASIQVQLRNRNTFTGSVLPSRGPVLGEDGEDWVGGALTAVIRPVLYDASRLVSSVTVDLRRTGGGQLRVATQTGTAPFSVSFDDEGAPGAANVVGYQTPAGATDQIRVVSATYSDGAGVPGVPARIGSDLRIDNVGPPAVPFMLPKQSAEHDCCLSNWAGAAFPFGDGVAPTADEGVGGLEVSIHAGVSTLADEELLETTSPILVGADLAATAENTALRAVAVLEDGLGNRTLVPLSPSDGNALSNARGGVFGVDLALPQLTFGGGSVASRAVNPAPGAAWVLAAMDAKSGVAASGARTTIRSVRPGVEGTLAACVFPATPECAPAPDDLVHAVPAVAEGYLVFESYVLDRAGNRSNASSRKVLLDVTAPAAPSMTLPSALVANGATTVSATLSDNVDLDRGWIALEFGGGGESLPLAAPEIFGSPFDDELVTAAGITQTFALVVAQEEVVAGPDGDAPSGNPLTLAAARAVVRDVAGNATVRSEALSGAGAFTGRSFSVAERGDEGGVRDWRIEGDVDRVCRAADACEEGVVGSVRLTATAAGLGGTLERPFDRVYFAVLRGGEPEWIGVSAAAEMSDAGGPLGREWSWRIDWTPPAGFPTGPVELIATGVDDGGNALRTLPLGSVVVEGTD